MKKLTAIAVVRSIMTQYATKEAMRLVEPEPAESKAIYRESKDINWASFTGLYPAIQLSTFDSEQRATSSRSHHQELVSTYEADVLTRNTMKNQIYGLNNVKQEVVGR